MKISSSSYRHLCEEIVWTITHERIDGSWWNFVWWSVLGSKCFTRFIAFKIKHTICDKLGCDLYLRGVNVLVIFQSYSLTFDSFFPSDELMCNLFSEISSDSDSAQKIPLESVGTKCLTAIWNFLKRYRQLELGLILQCVILFSCKNLYA